MTERLYYTDPYLREFDAELVDTVSHEGRTALVLDRSAFYPTSGGQPFDVGMFADVRVLDAKELAQWILADRLPVRLQLQAHKYIWSPETRGV
jgi:Ser-tRNA(Ala) deacylase AlaX